MSWRLASLRDMAKRSSYALKNKRGFYPTPEVAVQPLRAHLPPRIRYWEPCAGNGAIIRALPGCVRATDTKPLRQGIDTLNISAIRPFGVRWCGAQAFITNLPWPIGGKRGQPTLDMIVHLSELLPLWTILPFGFMCNQYSAAVHGRLVKIVPIGRVSWEGNGVGGKDDCAWHLFDVRNTAQPRIMARAA